MTPLEQLLEDGPRLSAVLQDRVEAAAQRGDWREIDQLARTAQRASDPLRAHAALRLASSALIAGGQAGLAQETDEARAITMRAVELLVDALEVTPHEPALLALLIEALLQLEEWRSATLIHEALKLLDPAQTNALPDTSSQPLQSLQSARADALGADSRERIAQVAHAASKLPACTVTLCMIVRDEESMLPDCLAAAAPHVDEIIIVDTGSVDRTREIAAQFGAAVIERPWDGSFSNARNAAIDAATSDWVIWLDADEQLVDDDGAQLRELARRTWIEGYHLVATNFTSSDMQDARSVHTPLRMIRNRPDYRWSGLVHEQVAHTLPTWLPGRIERSTVRVNHYGYTAAIVDERDKRRRNLDLLQTQLEQERTSFTCFNIGSEHAAMGDISEALSWFEEALELAQQRPHWRDDGFATLLVQRTVTARRALGQLDAAIKLTTDALGWWPSYTDLVYERAAALLQQERWDDARRDANRALEMGDAQAPYVAVTGKGSYQARTLLALIARRSGDLTRAREHLEQVLAEQPRYGVAINELVEVMLALEIKAEDASTQLDQLLEARVVSAGTELMIGAIFHEHGDFDVAAERYTRVLESQPQHGGALAALAELKLATGELNAAWDAGLAVDPLDARAAIGARTSFLAAAALDSAEQLAEPVRRIEASPLLGASERALYAAWAALLRPERAGVHALVPHDAEAADVLFRNLEALARIEATDAFELLHSLADRVVPDERERRMRLADLYLTLRFADMAAEELLTTAAVFGV
ncbi:MAG: glycosyltransferase, partial [Gaiellales bacterium]